MKFEQGIGCNFPELILSKRAVVLQLFVQKLLVYALIQVLRVIFATFLRAVKTPLYCRISQQIEAPLITQFNLREWHRWDRKEARFEEDTENALMLRLEFCQLEYSIYVLHFYFSNV